MNIITINCRCPLCGKTSFVTCTEEQWRAYENGALAQEAFADLTVCAREAIISGMCGDCQESFFEVDDEEE